MGKSTRLRSSWASVSYDPKRKVGRIRYWAETEDGYRRCSKTVRGSRKDVEEARAALMLDHSKDAPCPTVGQVWERWVRPDYVRRLEEGDIAKSTLGQFDSIWKVHVRPRWGGVPCDRVRALEVQQWLLGGMTHAQSKSALSIMKTIFEWAMRYDFVSSNVMHARYAMPSKSTVAARDKGVWSLAQLGEVWKSVHGSHIEPAFLLSAFGGCRVGESLGPMADEVREVAGYDVPVACVPIVRQAQNRGGMADALKTPQSRRTVVLVGRAASRVLQLARGNEGTWLTSNGVGGFVTQAQLVREWARLVPTDAYHPFRNLRNSWQTNMRWEMGMPPWVVEPLMGHVGQDVTGVYYDRPREEMFVEQAASAYLARPYDVGWTWLDSA